MKLETRSAALRRILNEPGCTMQAKVGIAHHAQLAELVGFKFVGISGSNTSTWVYGMPDAGYLTQTELVENTRKICNAVKIPVLVDADTGHGNALGVRRTVQLLIQAGAAGCFIEDQKSPKRCGFVKGKQLVSIDEAVGKYRAACDARDELDPDFVVFARTDGRGAVGGGFDEAVKRGNAYKSAGVDVIYVEGLQTREELKAYRKAVPDILLRASDLAIRPQMTVEEKSEYGLCMSTVPVGNVGTVAMYDFLVDFMKRGEAARIEFDERTKQHPFGGLGLFDLTGFPKVVEFEEKYLPREELDKYKEESLGLYDPRTGREGQIKKGL